MASFNAPIAPPSMSQVPTLAPAPAPGFSFGSFFQKPAGQVGEKASAVVSKGVLTEDVNNTFKIVAIIAIMLIIVFVTMYIVNMLKNNSLKQVKLLNKILQLDDRQLLPHIIPASKISGVSRGQEFSYNFWVYLSDSYDKTTHHKVLFQRGNPAESNGTALPPMLSDKTNPVVIMDKDSNKMLFAVNTSAVSTSMTLNEIFAKDPITKRYTSKYLITSIDYVPLQRWVNVTMSVRDNQVAVYMDGDLYSIVTTSDIVDSKGNMPFIRMPSGDVTVGDPINNIRGFMSKFSYFNYSLSQDQLMKVYNEGPGEKSFLSYFGLSRYGVRSPVYEIDGSNQ